MAERRMFTKKVTDSDAFIELPSSAQALYFHLNQGADDDGFNNQIQNAMFKSHSTLDDLKVLMMKNFIIRFESGVIVIKHWRLHNTLRKDRYTPTNFQEEFNLLGIKDNGSYTLNVDGCQMVAERLPQNSIGKVSIDKNSIDNNKEKLLYNFVEENYGRTLNQVEIQQIQDWLLLFDSEIIKYAIKKALLNGNKRFTYIDGILNNYRDKTLDEIIEEDEKRANRKTMTKSSYDKWSNTDVKKEKMTDEELKEVEDILKEFKDETT